MPIDRGIIDQQLQALGEGSRWWDVRELRDLPAVLHDDEQVLAISRGKLARLRWLRRTWLIVVTQKRLVCLRCAARAGWRQHEVSSDQITRIAIRVGPFRGLVRVVAGGHSYRLLVPRPDAYKLHRVLSSLGVRERASLSRFPPARMIRQMVDHLFALPAIALGPGTPSERPRPSAESPAFDERLQSLEVAVRDLREQMDFIEQLLQERPRAVSAAAAAHARTGAVTGDPV